MALSNWLANLLGGFAGGQLNKGGTEGGFQQQTRFTPEQQQLFNQMFGPLGEAQGSGLELLQQLLSGDEGAFEAFEAPFKRQFTQETMPEISERFAGLGTGGSMSSSGMQQSLAQAGGELSENLAALRGGLQQNALSQLQGFMAQAYQPTFENIYMQPTPSIFESMLTGAGGGAGNLAATAGMRSIGVG